MITTHCVTGQYCTSCGVVPITDTNELVLGCIEPRPELNEFSDNDDKLELCITEPIDITLFTITCCCVRGFCRQTPPNASKNHVMFAHSLICSSRSCSEL